MATEKASIDSPMAIRNSDKKSIGFYLVGLVVKAVRWALCQPTEPIVLQHDVDNLTGHDNHLLGALALGVFEGLLVGQNQ